MRTLIECVHDLVLSFEPGQPRLVTDAIRDLVLHFYGGLALESLDDNLHEHDGTYYISEGCAELVWREITSIGKEIM